MGRYSFFITFCSFFITTFGLFHDAIVYAESAVDDDINNDGLGEIVVPDDKVGNFEEQPELQQSEENKEENLNNQLEKIDTTPIDDNKVKDIELNEIDFADTIVPTFDYNQLFPQEEPFSPYQTRRITPRAFPSNNWGFSYQSDPKNWTASALPGFTNLRDSMYWFVRTYNDFVDHVARRINDLEGAFRNTLNQLNADNGVIFTAINKVRDDVVAVDAKVNRVVPALQGNITVEHDRITEVDYKVNSSVGSLQNNITAVDAKVNRVVGSLQGNITVEHDRITEVDYKVNRSVGSLQNNITSLDTKLNSNVKNLQNNISDIDTKLNSSVKNLQNNISDVDTKLNSNVKNLQNNIDLTNAALAVSVLNTSKNFAEINSKFDNEKLERIAEDAKLSLRIKELEEKKVDLSMFDVDLTLVDSSKTNGAEGSFTKLIKGQNSLLIKNIKDDFLALIKQLSVFSVDSVTTDATDKDGKFVQMLKRLIYAVRYTIMEEFKELKERLDLRFLELNNSINSVDLSLTTGLNNVSAWLQSIYNKDIVVSFPEIKFPEIPKIDYDRLQKMFDGIDIAKNITNQAGKNFWDFLIKLMDTLDKFISGSFDFVKWLTELLIDLIIPKDSHFFSNRISKLSDKFDKKFKFVLDLKDVFTGTMSAERVKLPKSFEFTFMDNKIQAPLDMLQMLADKVRLPMTGFMIFEILIFCYKKVTAADSGGVIE